MTDQLVLRNRVVRVFVSELHYVEVAVRTYVRGLLGNFAAGFQTVFEVVRSELVLPQLNFQLLDLLLKFQVLVLQHIVFFAEGFVNFFQ